MPRHLPAAPQFFHERYNTGERFTWCFAGFGCLRSSFYPDGYRTPQAINALCGSVLSASLVVAFCLSCTKFQLVYSDFVLFIFWTGFVNLDEEIRLEIENIAALVPPRAHVPQNLSVVSCPGLIFDCDGK